MPKLTRRSTEMEFVWAWFSEAIKSNTLKVEFKTLHDAYFVFVRHLSSYHLVHGEWRYDGYPSTKTTTVAPAYVPPFEGGQGNDTYLHDAPEAVRSFAGNEQSQGHVLNTDTISARLQQVSSESRLPGSRHLRQEPQNPKCYPN